MNRSTLIVPFFLFFVLACGGSDSSGNSSTESTGKVMQSEFLDTCQCTELEMDSTENYFKEGKLYTGICLDFYPTTTDKYVEKNLLNGRLHGKLTYYSRDGSVLIEEIYENGTKKRSGEVDVLKCACSELEKEATHIPQVPFRFKLDGIPYTGKCEELYPESSQIYVSRNYKDGIPDGHTVYYNRDGSTMIIEKYENGILVQAIN